MTQAQKPAKKALGRGLSALMGDFSLEQKSSDVETKSSQSDVHKLGVKQLRPGRFQPRRYFEDDALGELSESIKANGVLQPIIIRHLEHETYEIIAGERRWRASQLAGLTEVPVIIHTMDDKQALAVALLENIQRENLSPVEEAEGYQRLMKEFSYTQETLAAELGKSRSHVANLMRLLTLPEDVKRLLANGSLNMGQARAIVGHENAVSLAGEIIKKKLSARQSERLAKGWGTRAAKKASAGQSTPSAPISRQDTQFSSLHEVQAAEEKDPDLLALEQKLTDRIGVRVEIEETVAEAGGSGRVGLYFDSLDELDRIFQHLQVQQSN